MRSRYKFYKWLKSSHGIVILLTAHAQCRVTSCQEAIKQSLYRNKTYVQMRESGCINHYVTVMLTDAKVKTVTSLLTQLTVLAQEIIRFIVDFL